jgi:hypothetical protein
LRLNPRFRATIYGVIALMFVTGAAWLPADQLKDVSEIWQQVAANLLMIHGGGAMLTLMLLGALVPLHVLGAWRAGKNRVTGIAMATFNVALIATAFGLYYFGSETLRPVASWLHIGIGCTLPVLFLIHVVSGRRARAR